MFEKIFKLKKHQTSIKTEVIAGITTFLTMAYIIFVNPAILAHSGMDQGAVFTATCLVTAAATLLNALISNSPIAIGPGMALNAYFAFIVVQNYGYTWQNALGMVFISGIVFTLLTITKIRSLLIKEMPECLNTAIIAGISLFIALIALKTNNIIAINKDSFIQLGELNNLSTALFSLGFILIILLDYLKIPAPVLIGIITITLINKFVNNLHLNNILSMPPSIAPTFMKLEFNQLFNPHALSNIFSFLLIALFDATGTLVGLLHKPIFIKFKNSDAKIEKSILSDSFATTFASILGSSSTSPFIESAAGIAAGGRTGLTALVVAILFVCSLFLAPLISIIPTYAVGSALLYIACCIMKDITKFDTKDLTNFIPSILTMLMIPIRFSIADGIGIGVISYTLLKIITAKYRLLNPTIIILSIIFLGFFINKNIVWTSPH